jgi:hypothetical protein
MLHASRPRFEQKYILIIAHILINAYSPAIWKQKFHKSGMLPRFSVAKELEHSSNLEAKFFTSLVCFLDLALQRSWSTPPTQGPENIIGHMLKMMLML